MTGLDCLAIFLASLLLNQSARDLWRDRDVREIAQPREALPTSTVAPVR